MNLPPVYISTLLELVFMITLVIMKIAYTKYDKLSDKETSSKDDSVFVEEP
tara:strand:- start:3142 stop:3294 length:153 start_codon:yes stop_codon:yes gene_type:complete